MGEGRREWNIELFIVYLTMLFSVPSNKRVIVMNELKGMTSLKTE